MGKLKRGKLEINMGKFGKVKRGNLGSSRGGNLEGRTGKLERWNGETWEIAWGNLGS